MTAKLTSINGKKKPACMYCGLAPAERHPDLTCPRISGFTVCEDGSMDHVTFVDPSEWAVFVAECKANKGGENGEAETASDGASVEST